jgi:hypothetical protein
MTSSRIMRSRAMTLRGAGKTLREIGGALNISSSTAHLWTKGIKLTDLQKHVIWERHKEAFQAGRRRVALRQRQEREKEGMKYKQLGKNMVGVISKRELMLVGAALYWSEGFKRDSRLGFANSDPEMIKLFLRWLFEVGRVPKEDVRLRVGLNIAYKDEIDKIEQVWSELTGISLKQFQKPFFQKSKWVKDYKGRGEYLGVLRVRANKQGELFLTIKGMLEGLRELGG